MRKNGILTFCFAFIPGAGQMYQGYMKRGLSLITLFVLTNMLANIIALYAVVWMYSFFDTFNLRGQIEAGTAPKDGYLFGIDSDSTLEQLLSRRHRLIGWLLVICGISVLYNNILMDMMKRLSNESSSQLFRAVYRFMGDLPTLVVCAALVALGVWLVRGPQLNKAATAEDTTAHEPQEQSTQETGLFDEKLCEYCQPQNKPQEGENDDAEGPM